MLDTYTPWGYLMNELINVREAAIRLLTGAKAGEVLNDMPYHGAVLPCTDLVAAIKRAVNEFQHEAFADDGRQVDYARLKASPAYQAYRRELTPQLRRLELATLETREQKLAFWINLYNALVIDAVITFEVRRSVTERMAGLAFFRWAAYEVGGQRYSCDDIESGILRNNAGNPFIFGPQFRSGDPRLRWLISPLDPRIHFALNCASRSCPPIGVYTSDKIDAQLDMATRNFVAADTEINQRNNTLTISSIYNWYKDDFGGPEGIVQFVRHYLPADERRAWLERGPELHLVHRSYDWALNV
jgi:hypothetical protein